MTARKKGYGSPMGTAARRVLLAVALGVGTPVIGLATPLPAARAAIVPTLPLTVGKGVVLSPGAAISKVSVTDPAIADVAVISRTEVLVNGKKPGATTLMLWAGGQRKAYDVLVKVDAEVLRRLLAQALGANKVQATISGDTVILTGHVDRTSDVQMAGQIAQGFAAKVVNLLTANAVQQVQVDVEVVEMDKSAGADLGVKYGSLQVDPNGTPTFVPDVMTFAEGSIGQIGTFGQVDRLSAQLQLLIKEGKAKLLAKPSLMALSGGKASFLVGGQVPIPEAQQFGTVTISWRDYGVKLDVEPTVEADGRIDLKVKPEVSSLDFTNGIRVNSFLIPALTTRRAQTEVLLSSGQGVVIGGLLQNQQSTDIEKLPLLGDIPIIGELFRSTKFQQDQTDLTIMVTPHLVGQS